MARYYSSLFGQLAFKFFSNKDGRLHFVRRHQEKFFSNKDGRLHFVRRHP